MEFSLPNTKKLYLAVEISQLLHQYNCTYNEADFILNLITKEIKQQREDLEYDFVFNDINESIEKVRVCNADNRIIQKLNHCPPYG